MRFLIAVLDHEGNPGTDEEMAAIDDFNDGLRRNGHWIMACGIESAPNATVVDNRGGAGLVNAGPHSDQAEYMSGFWIVQAANREEALALAAEGSRCCNRKVEVRALLGT